MTNVKLSDLSPEWAKLLADLASTAPSPLKRELEETAARETGIAFEMIRGSLSMLGANPDRFCGCDRMAIPLADGPNGEIFELRIMLSARMPRPESQQA